MYLRQIASPLTAGFLLLALLWGIEWRTSTDLSVAYVLTILLVLRFSWKSPNTLWLALFATSLILVGFVVTDPIGERVVINRSLSVVTVWAAVMFVRRYRRLSNAESIQKRQLQALFENATEGMIFTDSNGRIVRINPAAERMFGYEKDALLRQPIEVLVPESGALDHEAYRLRLVKEPVQKPKGAGRELPARRSDGSEFFAEVSLSFFYEDDEVFYIAFIVDISERKRQEAVIEKNVANVRRLNAALDAKVRLRTSELVAANLKLRREISERKLIGERLAKSQQLHHAVAKNFPDGMIGILDNQKRFILADGKEVDFIQCRPIGRRLFDDQPELMNQSEKNIEEALMGGHVNFDIVLKDRTYDITAVPLPDLEGRISEVLVVMKNVTAKRNAERELIKMVEKEKQLSVLKSRFVTMASHEFRTPLTTILSSVFLLQQFNGDKYENQKKTHLDRITRSIQTLTELMNDFLSMGRLEEGQIKAVYSPVEVHAYLRETVAELQSIRKGGQRIAVNFTGDETTIMTDRQMLTNILRNLISNAVKYSPEQSEISIEAQVTHGELLISVADQGMGIPDSEQSEIFKRFFRAENATNIQGTGLGLNIVKKYVSILQGDITFKSKLNEGTIFNLKLPVRDLKEIHQTANPSLS